MTYLLEIYVSEVLVAAGHALSNSKGLVPLPSDSSRGDLGSSAASSSRTALAVLLQDAAVSVDGGDELYADHGPGGGGLFRPTLQLIPNLHSPLQASLIRYDRMPQLLVYGLLEFIFTVVAATWCGSWLAAPQSQKMKQATSSTSGIAISATAASLHSQSNGRVSDWAAAMALAAASKLLYIAFLIWDIPVYLTVVVDITYFMWVLQGTQTVAPQARVRSCVVVVVTLALLRCFFRRMTRWCSFFVSADAFHLSSVV
jgi:hypothetical protein